MVLAVVFLVLLVIGVVAAVVVDLRGRRPKSWVSEQALGKARAADEGRYGKGTPGGQGHGLGGL